MRMPVGTVAMPLAPAAAQLGTSVTGLMPSVAGVSGDGGNRAGLDATAATGSGHVRRYDTGAVPDSVWNDGAAVPDSVWNDGAAVPNVMADAQTAFYGRLLRACDARGW
ncbi:hypothetical protein HK104_010402 [Borealophlyctis nickersoniae]|nr:hypothetical protein HK104_010402 [Borealophlyctis nickersoniae]